MRKEEIISKCYNMACHNLLCYSASCLMEEPKEGYEAQFEQAKVECELLKEILDEYAGSFTDTIRFVGYISGYSVGVNLEGQQYIKLLTIHDRDDNHRLLEIDYELGRRILESYDEERHQRYDINKDTEMVFTVKNASQHVVDWEWKVK